MHSPTFDLDALQKEMLVFLPALDTSALCCCAIIDPRLSSKQHLDDCELRCCASRCDSNQGGTTNDVAMMTDELRTERRKKHRESMARLRQGWRTSIAALHQQEEQLQRLLERTLTTPIRDNFEVDTRDAPTPLEALRRAYRELVEEQIILEKEQLSLEATRMHREKYERLLQRELERVRMFHLTRPDV